MMIARPGIDIRFPSARQYLKTWQDAVPEPIGRIEYLERYAEAGRFPLGSTQSGLPERFFDRVTCPSELRRCANDIAQLAIAKALSGDDISWRADWSRVIAYFRWAFHLEFQFHSTALHQFEKGERRQRLALIPFDDVVWVMANCWLLGWRQAGLDMYELTIRGLDDRFFTGKTQGMRRAHYFCLRLVSDNLGRESSREWPPFALDEPIYEALLTDWRVLEASTLLLPILAACDRHTYQARPDTDSTSYDFRRYPQMYQPFEVLLLMRFREWERLRLPDVQHPLLATPLGALSEEVPEYNDELLRGVVARAEQERARE